MTVFKGSGPQSSGEFVTSMSTQSFMHVDKSAELSRAESGLCNDACTGIMCAILVQGRQEILEQGMTHLQRRSNQEAHVPSYQSGFRLGTRQE